MTKINNVSDTARWVAVYRAMETQRPDALFRDPYAATLAGDQGQAIVDHLKQGRQMAWAMIVRTAVFDEIILDRVKNGGVDLVLNLAAGLDARPWRMHELPPSLRWVDVDLPEILDYKLETLASEKTVCRYDAVRVDLTDGPKRRALFAQIGSEAACVLVVTEGLLIYLTEEQVGALAADMHGAATFRWWLIDLINPYLLKMISRSWGKQLDAGNAPFKFAPASGTAFFESFGWREAEFRSGSDEAHRLNRTMRMHWLWRLVARFASPARRERYRRMSGYALLERR